MAKNEFKVGDKVRVTNSWGMGENFKNGDIVTVTALVGNICNAARVAVNGNNNEGLGFNEERFELVKEKLRLPLLVKSDTTYFLTKNEDTGKIDLISAAGNVYKNHVTEERAIELIKQGSWKVVVAGGKSNAKLEAAVKSAEAKLAEAQQELETAKAALAHASFLQ